MATTVPSPIEPTREQNYGGIHLNYEYNVNIPIWVLDERWWNTEGGGRKPSVDVIRVYAWLLDKVTDTADGIGSVLGGRYISNRDIGTTFGISWSCVRRSTEYLVKVGLISRVQDFVSKEYKYTVLHCRKEFEGKQDDGTFKLRGKTFSKRPTVTIDHTLPSPAPSLPLQGLPACSPAEFLPASSHEEIDFPPESASFNIDDDEEDDDLSQPLHCGSCGECECVCYAGGPVL